MDERRPDPDTLLKRVQEDERQEKTGKLRIYLGAAPGVGKTHAMLRSALAQCKTQDVLVGIAESHGRKEIDDLLKELDILPRQVITYRGQQLSEFDLDAALRRRPSLILVDEMAHTNAPGSRHEKRWQDIKELLDRGIHVYTTLNVQHIESLNDDVSQIIHAPVKEMVPDSMLEMADTIELVDLPPEDLLRRLQEGKVYYPEKAELAQKFFFRKGNLIALRELALRVTAERVGSQVFLYRQREGIKHIWATQEKIIVCVGPGPESVKLVRAACRRAANLKAAWIAVYVETARVPSSQNERNKAIQHLRMAQQLGAETRILTGIDVVKEILNYAREQNVTQIMIWKHIRPRWMNFFRKNLTDELVRHSGEIDVYIMTGEITKTAQVKYQAVRQIVPWWTYLISLCIISIALLIDFVLYPYLQSSNLFMVYLSAGVVIVLLLVTQVISHLTVLTRRQSVIARNIEYQTSASYHLSRLLTNTRGIDKLLETGMHYLEEIFNSDILAFIPRKGRLEIRTAKKLKDTLSDKENSVAQWVYELGQTAGLGTGTLPFSDALYIPLLASQGTVGVLRVHPRTKSLFTPEQIHLLETCANQIALAIEIGRLYEKTRRAEKSTESTRGQNALLQSISHDLRAPLISIMANASTQIEMKKELDSKTNLTLAKNIYTEAEQLNRLINNLLQMTYLESDSVALQKLPCSLQETVVTVIKASSNKLGKRVVQLHAPPDLPPIPFDQTLMQEVFVNLLDNAVKFTPSETPIDISIILEASGVLVSVEDKGPGIMADEVDKLFEKFYRGRQLTTEYGLGLGLVICQHIIKAHGGRIWAENRAGGGASFRFTLPFTTIP